MLRRTALGALFGAGVSRFLGPARGTVMLMDFRTRRVIVSEHPEMARSWLLPPGSTLKPFSVLALMDAGKLADTDVWPCPGKLTIAGRSLACSHPPIGSPMRISTALAYSCNCFVAHFAGRFEAGELARRLERAGLAGQVQGVVTTDASRLQALGESGVMVTPVEMLMAYHWLAARAQDEKLGPIIEGLEGAVDYGTAQRAGVAGVRVAGKTGSVMTGAGMRAAWFAGFAPARAPEVVVITVLQGRSGGADAAPIAGRLLEAHFAGRH